MSDPAPLDPEWLKDFEAAARRPLRLRIDYSFIRTPQPVIDDEPYRVFDTMEAQPLSASTSCPQAA